MDNSKKYGEIGELGWSIMKYGQIGEMGWSTTMGVEKLRIRRNMEKSEKWAGRPWGVGKWRIRRNRRNGLADHYGGQEMENSKKYGEIREMGWSTMGGQGSGEF